MNNETEHIKKSKLPALWLAVAAVLLALTSVFSVFKLRQSLYEERAYNSGRVMNKIAANIRTVIKTRGDKVNFIAGLIAERELADDGQVACYLRQLESMSSTEEGDNILLLIDKAGNCLTSDGTVFRWEESGILHTNEEHVLVSSINALGLPDEQMLFLVPLPEEKVTADRTFTHICLVMDQSVVENYLRQAQYVDKSAIFIIKNDGTYIYKQTDGSAFSNVFNLVSKLESWDYSYKTTAAQTIENIKERKSGCSFVKADGENYFVVYESLYINDWTAVYIVPEKGASSNSSSFMTTIILVVVVLAVIVMATVLGILISGHIRSIKHREQVNEQLQKAVEAEQNANNAKTRFLSSMSHDIRTPMNAIVGMTALAEKHIDDTAYVDNCLSKIHLASDHLLTLINDILDISKIESGKMSLSPTVFSLADSVNNMFNIVSPQAKAKDQTLNIHVELIPHEFLLADELRLNQVFINIISNAIKYTPEKGTITVTIKEESLSTKFDSVRLRFIVEDNGIGMTEEFMENMYGTFSRATDSRVNKIQGSGLGLAICKQLIEMMGGVIECESEVGKGTKFTIILDILTAEPPTGSFRLPKLKLLIVDDDEMFLTASAELLAELGPDVDTADSGKEAIKKTRELIGRGDAYAAILMDWEMAGLDGIETLKKLHETVDANVPIILISAYDSTDIEQIALEAGAVGFIRKPFFKASLCRQLISFLKLEETAELVDNENVELSGMNILVAEDNDLNWEIAYELLYMNGINAVRAENGQLCVDRMNASEDGEFDAILMDIQMPILNGRAASRVIRMSEREYLRNIPIIAMTADAFAEDIAACLEAGMNAHISKPINFERLFAELKKIKNNANNTVSPL